LLRQSHVPAGTPHAPLTGPGVGGTRGAGREQGFDVGVFNGVSPRDEFPPGVSLHGTWACQILS